MKTPTCRGLKTATVSPSSTYSLVNVVFLSLPSHFRWRTAQIRQSPNVPRVDWDAIARTICVHPLVWRSTYWFKERGSYPVIVESLSTLLSSRAPRCELLKGHVPSRMRRRRCSNRWYQLVMRNERNNATAVTWRWISCRHSYLFPPISPFRKSKSNLRAQLVGYSYLDYRASPSNQRAVEHRCNSRLGPFSPHNL